MIDWRGQAERMTLDGYNAREIADALGMDYERVRGHIKRFRKAHGISRENHGSFTVARYCNERDNLPTTESVTEEVLSHEASVPEPTPFTAKSSYCYQNGISVYEDEQEIIGGREITPEIIMEAKGLDPDEWDVLSFTKNVWQQQTKDGRKIDLCQSKLSVKPKIKRELTLGDIDRFFEEHRYTPCLVAQPFCRGQQNGNGATLELCYCDAHMGLLSCSAETGEDFDLHEARRRIAECTAEVVNRCRGRNIKKIELCLLGDILHVENDSNATAKGTPQDVSTRFYAIVDETIDAICDIINTLKVIAPISVTWVCGNHSRNSEYIVMKVVQAMCSGIDFDISPNPIKNIRIGDNALVRISHGDAGRKNITNHVDAAARKLGGIKYIEQHCGHLHSEMSFVDHGILVRFLPTICGTSAWEHTQGYTAPRSFLSFLWDDTKGITEYWINNID